MHVDSDYSPALILPPIVKKIPHYSFKQYLCQCLRFIHAAESVSSWKNTLSEFNLGFLAEIYDMMLWVTKKQGCPGWAAHFIAVGEWTFYYA